MMRGYMFTVGQRVYVAYEGSLGTVTRQEAQDTVHVEVDFDEVEVECAVEQVYPQEMVGVRS